jgi:hypothetical protein
VRPAARNVLQESLLNLGSSFNTVAWPAGPRESCFGLRSAAKTPCQRAALVGSTQRSDF